MVADRKLVLRLMAMLSAAVALVLGGCTQGGTLSSPTQSLSTTPAGSSSPACDLITPDIAVKVDPGLAQMGQGGKPAGSPAYLCSYMSKANKGRTLSVSLTSPASAAEIVEAKQTPDCSTVAGIGDFACMQWTGWFRGEPGGASANTVLKAVRGNESLDLRIVDMPPISPEFPVPDGEATARALAQALVDGGWGNGSELRVPPAPSVGPQTSTTSAVCALVGADALGNAFGATTQAAVFPGEGNCRYLFGALSTPGPDSLIFSIELHQGGASLLSRQVPDGQSIEGVGDQAVLIIRSEPGGPKSLRPGSDAPVSVMSLMVARGQSMAIFTAEILISPNGTAEKEVKEQFVTLVKSIDF
ncbi:hypothetical protein NicSoilE8_07930 [Arthrobacter sp. NicSoilE8]|nr:hypothetical protein NicSoilE8_07930 [Arthrobacter sp. NicSoilE8]